MDAQEILFAKITEADIKAGKLVNQSSSLQNSISKLAPYGGGVKFDNEPFKEEKIYTDDEYESTIIYRFKNEKPYTITKEDGIWVLKGEEIEKLFKMTRFTEDEGVKRFARKLKGMGVDEELERLGAKPGDEVQILEYVFEWKE